jgi:hypothetical protein
MNTISLYKADKLVIITFPEMISQGKDKLTVCDLGTAFLMSGADAAGQDAQRRRHMCLQ